MPGTAEQSVKVLDGLFRKEKVDEPTPFICCWIKSLIYKND